MTKLHLDSAQQNSTGLEPEFSGLQTVIQTLAVRGLMVERQTLQTTEKLTVMMRALRSAGKLFSLGRMASMPWRACIDTDVIICRERTYHDICQIHLHFKQQTIQT